MFENLYYCIYNITRYHACFIASAGYLTYYLVKAVKVRLENYLSLKTFTVLIFYLKKKHIVGILLFLTLKFFYRQLNFFLTSFLIDFSFNLHWLSIYLFFTKLNFDELY